MRHTFYTTDETIEKIMEDFATLLKGWGLKGSYADVIRYALYYAAEGHGFRDRSKERTFRSKPDKLSEAMKARKGGDDGKHAHDQDRQGVDDDGTP